MRLHGRIIALASAGALAASSTPASAIGVPSDPGKPTVSVAAHQDPGSPELLLGLAAAGGVALLGTGLVATRHRRRPARSDRRPDAAHGAWTERRAEGGV